MSTRTNIRTNIRTNSHSLFFVRHGETEWNREGRIQGILDSPLTDRGRTQARVNAELLKSFGVTDLLASPLGRAADTTRIMVDVMDAEHSFDGRLKERNCGAWGGLTWDEAEGGYPEIWQARSEDPYHFSPPGGESLVAVEPRIRTLLSDIDALASELAPEGRRLGVVTHGITMRVLLKCLLDLEPQFVSRIRCPNDVVYEVTANGAARECQHYVGGEGPVSGLYLSAPGVMQRS